MGVLPDRWGSVDLKRDGVIEDRRLCRNVVQCNLGLTPEWEASLLRDRWAYYGHSRDLGKDLLESVSFLCCICLGRDSDL